MWEIFKNWTIDCYKSTGGKFMTSISIRISDVKNVEAQRKLRMADAVEGESSPKAFNGQIDTDQEVLEAAKRLGNETDDVQKAEVFLKSQLKISSIGSSKAPFKLKDLGMVFEVRDTNFLGVILKKEGVEKVTGEKLEKIFASCPANKKYSVVDGYITDIDLHQNIALLEALNDAGLDKKMGMFNVDVAGPMGRWFEFNIKGFDTGKFKSYWTGQTEHLTHDRELDPKIIHEFEINNFSMANTKMGNFSGPTSFTVSAETHDKSAVVVFGVEK
jgi:hypothetical protein